MMRDINAWISEAPALRAFEIRRNMAGHYTVQLHDESRGSGTPIVRTGGGTSMDIATDDALRQMREAGGR